MNIPESQNPDNSTVTYSFNLRGGDGGSCFLENAIIKNVKNSFPSTGTYTPS